MTTEMLPAEKIYNDMANNVPNGFWNTPSHEGVSLMKDILSALKPMSNQLFAGKANSLQTVTTVANQMDYIERRIQRWENCLALKNTRYLAA